MAAHGNSAGYDITSQNYFSELKRQTGEDIAPPRKQSFSEARKKLCYETFEFLLDCANQEKVLEKTWHEHPVRALDGSKLRLPHSDELLEHFEQPKSKVGLGHYPQALLVTAINVFTGQPVAARVENYRASERDLLIDILDQFKPGDLSLLDRGFGGDHVFITFEEKDQKYLVRMKGGKTAPDYIQEFIRGRKKSQMIILEFVDEFGETFEIEQRLVRGPLDSQGKRIIFATNLTDENIYTVKSILRLYERRWDVETMYGRSKNLLKLENFHSHNYDGVMQEIFANLVVLSLTALLVTQTSDVFGMNQDIESPSFKNAYNVIRRYFFEMVRRKPPSRSVAENLAAQMIDETARVLWKKQPNRKFPRVSKLPINSWNLAKDKKLKEYYGSLN